MNDELAAGKIDVLFVDDDAFTRAMVNDGLEAGDMAVRTCTNVAEAIEQINLREPHVVVSDLDLGPGPTGSDLLLKVDQDWPWIAKVALTAHATADLAVGEGARLPGDTLYVVKGDLLSIGELHDWVVASLLPISEAPVQGNNRQRVLVTPAQAAAIRLIAKGLSNSAIAEQRGITLRSAESLVHRSFQALGLEDNKDINRRVAAAMMWRRGQITTRSEETLTSATPEAPG